MGRGKKQRFTGRRFIFIYRPSSKELKALNLRLPVLWISSNPILWRRIGWGVATCPRETKKRHGWAEIWTQFFLAQHCNHYNPGERHIFLISKQILLFGYFGGHPTLELVNSFPDAMLRQQTFLKDLPQKKKPLHSPSPSSSPRFLADKIRLLWHNLMHFMWE